MSGDTEQFSRLVTAHITEADLGLEFDSWKAALLWLSHPESPPIVDMWTGPVTPTTKEDGLTLLQSIQVRIYLNFLQTLGRGEGDFFFNGPYMIVRSDGTDYLNGSIGVSRGGSEPEFFGAVFWVVVFEILRNGQVLDSISPDELAPMAMAARDIALS